MEFTGATSTRDENPRQPVLGIGGRVAVNPHNPHPNTANPGAWAYAYPRDMTIQFAHVGSHHGQVDPFLGSSHYRKCEDRVC